MRRARALLLPGLMTAVMLAALLALGVWQLHRLAWKTDLLARIDAAESAPGVPLGRTVPPAFTKVVTSGRFLPRAGLYGVDVRGQTLGAFLIQPLIRDGAPPLLVQRGWVAEAAAVSLRAEGDATVTGYVRLPDRPGWFSPADDLAAHRFYTLDPAVIGPALGVSDAAPIVLVALGGPATPDPARALPRPPNDHLQYALTWFGLALVLLVVFAVHARKVLVA